MNKLVSRAVLVAMGVLAAIVVAEAGLAAAGLVRGRGDDREQEWVTRHELFGWFHVPGVRFRYRGRYEKTVDVVSTINSKGLREREYAYEKRDGVFRTLILGDSFTASFEVPLEQTWHEILEAALSAPEHGVRPHEVIAAGVQGYSTDQEFLYYLHEGYKYTPDLVVLQVYPNDIYGNGADVMRRTSVLREQDKPFFVLEGHRLVLTDPFRSARRAREAASRRGTLRNVRVFLQTHLQTYRLAREAVRGRPRGRQTGPFCYSFDGVPFPLFTFAADFPEEYEAAWAVTARLVEELRSETSKRGQRFAVVYIPDRRQVLPDVWQDTLDCWPEAARLAWDLDKPNRLLGDVAGRLGIPYLDLTRTFRDHMSSPGTMLYFVNDWHLNPTGHQYMARLVHEWLVRERLIR